MDLYILSDNGPEFVNNVLTELYGILKTKHLRTSNYLPQCNGAREKCNYSITSILAKFVDKNQANWDILLDAALIHYRTRIHATTGESPFQLVFGRKMRLPSDLIHRDPILAKVDESEVLSNISKNILLAQEMARYHTTKQKNKMKTTHDTKAKPSQLQVGDWVYLKVEKTPKGLTKKFQPKYDGPFKILEILSDVSEIGYL